MPNPQIKLATKEATSDNIPLANKALTVPRKRTIYKIDTADCAKTIAEKNNKKPEANNSLSLSPTIDPPIVDLQDEGNHAVTLHLAHKSYSQLNTAPTNVSTPMTVTEQFGNDVAVNANKSDEVSYCNVNANTGRSVASYNNVNMPTSDPINVLLLSSANINKNLVAYAVHT